MHYESRGPRAIGDILAEVMARGDFARARSEDAYQSAWQESVGETVAAYTRTGRLNRGTLEIIVANSMLVQEFTFQKADLLDKLKRKLPGEKIRGLRFKVGKI
jgi:predicted nucleic acid-binding Zn ribbon protein